MREIKMKSISAGPEGVFHLSQFRTLPKHEAAALVLGGHAEYTAAEPPEKAVIAPEEAAVIEAPEEAEAEEKPAKAAKDKVKK